MATFEIQSESLAKRCEICHQADCFDAVTNTCRRCQKVTIALAPTQPEQKVTGIPGNGGFHFITFCWASSCSLFTFLSTLYCCNAFLDYLATCPAVISGVLAIALRCVLVLGLPIAIIIFWNGTIGWIWPSGCFEYKTTRGFRRLVLIGASILGGTVLAGILIKSANFCLLWAIHRNEQAVRFVLNHGASGHMEWDHGFRSGPPLPPDTSVAVAIVEGNPTIVKMLLDHGAKLDRKPSYQSRTELMWAIEKNDYQMVKLLLDYGANPNEHCFGQSVLKVADRSHANPEIIKLLQEHGARVE